MKARSTATAIAGSLALAACGGGAAIAVLGSLGAGGGDWFVDADNTAAGYQPRRNCGGQTCTININPESLYQRDYAITAGGTLPGCSGSHAGTVSDAVNVSIPGCFTGRFLSVNEMVSNDGQLHAYFDFFPSMSTGVWVDIQDDSHRLVFTSNAAGCEVNGTTKRTLTLAIQNSNFRSYANDTPTPTLVSNTSITRLTIQGTPVREFTGEFVGASGLRLTRSGETIELQRRDLQGNCN